MAQFTVLSPSEQVAAHLRSELMKGTWTGEMPGTPLLAGELGLDRKTIIAALLLLEKEGLLVPQGHGRRRRIHLPTSRPTSALRIAIQDYDPSSASPGYIAQLRHLLAENGHFAFFTPKSLTELKMNLKRVIRQTEQTQADAWVIAGGSREILDWFASQPTPAFAFAGRLRNVPLASIGPDKLPAMLELVRRLVSLGHRRIVFLLREERRKPEPGYPELTLLAELQKLGVQVGPYNLPDWKDSKEGLHQLLDSLFQHTPPTAILTDESFLFAATQNYLARRGILAPEHVSLACADPDPTFQWSQPMVSHIRWDSRAIVRRIARWANNIARGKDDRRKSFCKAEFIEGGTIGPVPR